MTVLDANGRDPEADDYARMIVCWLSDKRTVQVVVKRHRLSLQNAALLHGLLCEHLDRKGKALLTPEQIRRDMLNLLEDRTIRLTIARKVALDELEELERDGWDLFEDHHPGLDAGDTKRIRTTLQNMREALDKQVNSLIVQP